ncbi:MAG: hypothetical protein IKI17_04210 [Oscillospiraceae bacterium]|nr:hypothetical protein [Oscillospiraceae bacterium]
MRKQFVSILIIFVLCISVPTLHVIAANRAGAGENEGVGEENGLEPILGPALPLQDEAEESSHFTDMEYPLLTEDQTAPLHGTCGAEGDGTNLTWTLDDDGILTISGTGRMAEFGNATDASTAPWNPYRSSIQSIVIEDGVTSIGDVAFVYSHYSNLFLPASVIMIHWAAFYGTRVDHVYYSGTEEQWGEIKISSYNSALNGVVVESNPELYVIRYDANGGNGSMPVSHYVEGQEFTLPACGFVAPLLTTPMYYSHFQAWNVDGEAVLPGTVCTFHQDTTVIAIWETRKLESGDITVPKMTREQISDLLAANPLTLPKELFDEQPSVTAPYRTGKLKDEVLQITVNRLTALRAIAGLPAVELDASMCESAQYGAVLLAASKFSHYPPQPEDMDDEFYRRGYSATSSSNIASGYTIVGAVDGFMDDESAKNIISVGHRRWQLTPELKKVGFGYAKGKTTEKITDHSGPSIEYRFLGWPSSGYFPNNLFWRNVPWSIELNSATYKTTSQVSVLLTRESDGRVWSFSEDQDYDPSTNGDFFQHSGKLLIFRPGDVEKYEGLYTVSVSGITDQAGQAVDFTYQVSFFDANYYTSFTVEDVSATGQTARATIACPNPQASVYCAIYDENGRMVSAASTPVTDGDSYTFSFPGCRFATAVFYVLDEDLRPLCASRSCATDAQP